MSSRRLKICAQGHRFYKSSDCPACPVCAKNNKPENGFLSLLAAPARRALESKGISTVEQLSTFTEKDILAFHGMGKASLPILYRALDQAGLSFKTEIKE